MSRSRPYRASRRACTVIGVQHEALLRSIGGNLCDYCSKRGSPGCAWEPSAGVASHGRAASLPIARPPIDVRAPAGPRGQSIRHAAEVASHLGP